MNKMISGNNTSPEISNRNIFSSQPDLRQEDFKKKKVKPAALRKIRRLRCATDLRDLQKLRVDQDDREKISNRARSCTLPTRDRSPPRIRSTSRNALSRLAASLHLPHYFGQGVITTATCLAKDIAHNLDNESTSVPFFGLKRKHGVNGQQHTEYPCLYRTFSSSPTEERIVAYNDHLDALVRCTSDDHEDYVTLKGHNEDIEQWMLRGRLDEIQLAQNEQKLDHIESQFPADQLGLLQGVWLNSALRRAFAISNGSTMNNVKQFVGRRKSLGSTGIVPPNWFRNSVDSGDIAHAAMLSDQKIMDGQRIYQHQSSLSKLQSARSSPPMDISAYQRSPRQREEYIQSLKQQQHSKKTETFVRVYLKEGRVVLNMGVQTQERYLFLFSDLLLVAKENYRGINSYRLKERVRLCEVWLTDKALDEVADTVRNAQHSFVIGWPTKSYVAEFKSAEERNSWYEMLASTIASVKQKERPSATIINLKYKDEKIVKTCDISINNFQSAREVLSSVVPHFVTPPISPDEYQLWVQSGRETAAYPLYGHEYPFAILLSHIRDLLPDSDGDVDMSLLNDLTVSGHGIKCSFTVKKKRGTKKRKPSKHGAGQFVSHLKRKMKKQDSADSACPPSPTGKLFGIPLDVLSDAQSIPKPVLVLMEHLASDGVFMEGIFRKPPKNSTLRELKEKLDAGLEVDFSGVSPSVSASLLKEFFRQLPDSVLVNEKLNDWVSLCDEMNADQKLRKAKTLAAQLPLPNFRLLQYFMCLLRLVADRASYNQMNSFNLGICVAPSLSGASRCGSLNGALAKRMTELTQYLIDNVIELFGASTLTLLKAPMEQPSNQPSPVHGRSPVLQCTSGDRELFGHSKQEMSSLDSLTAIGNSSAYSRPQSSPSQAAMHVSRDSGLSESHGPLDDLTVTASMPRCLSQSEDTEDDIPQVLVSQSVDNLTTMNAQKRATRIVSDPDAVAACNKKLESTGATLLRDENLYRQKVNVDSTDSIYESTESNSSMVDCRHMATNGVRSSKRLPTALLTRSASGDHLYLTERITIDEEPAIAQELRQSRRYRPPVSGPNSDKERPLTVMLTAGDSSYGSSPVSPESNIGILGGGEESSQSCNTSPSPVPFMTRNSAYRKPARHRKGSAPQPPSPANVCIDDDEDGSETGPRDQFDIMVASTDASNDDEADSGVHVMEVHAARPIVISCNCDSSSSMSSDDEKTSSNAVATPKTQEISANTSSQPLTPSPPMISEIYPLKSPAHPAWPVGATKFLVDSVPTPPRSSPTVVRRNSSQFLNPSVNASGNNDVRRSCNNDAALTERISRGLDLMMEKLENAHISQEKLLCSRISDAVNDSSTVTEASSEESTPHVSRESSSAQEYKQVAQVMFDRPHLEISKPIREFPALQPGSSQTLPSTKPATRREVFEQTGPSTMNRRPNYNSNLRSAGQGPYPSNTTALMPQYRATLIQTSDRPVVPQRPAWLGVSSRRDAKDALTSKTQMETPSDAIEHKIPVRVVPLAPGQAQTRIQRYDRERLRRKTLGGSEFSALGELAAHQTHPVNSVESSGISVTSHQTDNKFLPCDQPSPSSNSALSPVRGRTLKPSQSPYSRSTSLDRRLVDFQIEEPQKESKHEDDGRRRQDISWSVRQYVKMFDGSAKNSPAARRPNEEKQSGISQQTLSGNRVNGSSFLVSRLKPTDYRVENHQYMGATRAFLTTIPSSSKPQTKASSVNSMGPSYMVTSTRNTLGNSQKHSVCGQSHSESYV